MPHSIRRLQTGFTLVEVMVVALIVAILAGIAIPSYNSFVTKSRRSAAKTALLEVAARQENYFADLKKYADKASALRYPADTFYLNSQGDESGVKDANSTYAITVSQTTTFDYLITATAIALQAKDTECAKYTLDYRGTREATNTSCWK